MATMDGKVEVKVIMTSDQQRREIKVALPLYLAIEDGELTAEAVAAIREKVATVAGGLATGRQLRLVDAVTGEARE